MNPAGTSSEGKAGVSTTAIPKITEFNNKKLSNVPNADVDALARDAEEALFDWLEHRDAPNEPALRASFAARSQALEIELRGCPQKKDCPCRWPRGHQA